MATVAAIHYLVQAHIRNLDNRISGFEEGLREIADGLHDLLVDIVPTLDPVDREVMLKQVVHLQSQIRSQLTTLGYSELVQDFISGYDESEIFSRQVLEALGRVDLIRVPLRPDTLQQIKQLDLATFEEFGANAVRRLAKEVTLNALVGKPRSAIIRSLDQVLDSKFVGQGATLADTALRQYDRTVTMSDWEEAGIDRFEYFGPRDNKNSEWCAERVGKIYTAAQVERMLNPAGRPAKIHGGHPRCRHVFAPRPSMSPDED